MSKLILKSGYQDRELITFEADSDCEIEEKLVAWFLECNDYETTLKMIKQYMNVSVEEIIYEVE